MLRDSILEYYSLCQFETMISPMDLSISKFISKWETVSLFFLYFLTFLLVFVIVFTSSKYSLRKQSYGKTITISNAICVFSFEYFNKRTTFFRYFCLNNTVRNRLKIRKKLNMILISFQLQFFYTIVMRLKNILVVTWNFTVHKKGRNVVTT